MKLKVLITSFLLVGTTASFANSDCKKVATLLVSGQSKLIKTVSRAIKFNTQTINGSLNNANDVVAQFELWKVSRRQKDIIDILKGMTVTLVHSNQALAQANSDSANELAALVDANPECFN